MSDKILRNVSNEEDIRKEMSILSSLNSKIIDGNINLSILRNFLSKRVLYQQKAIEKISLYLITYLKGLRLRESPLTFLLAGPTAVGKTSLAFAIADYVKKRT